MVTQRSDKHRQHIDRQITVTSKTEKRNKHFTNADDGQSAQDHSFFQLQMGRLWIPFLKPQVSDPSLRILSSKADQLILWRFICLASISVASKRLGSSAGWNPCKPNFHLTVHFCQDKCFDQASSLWLAGFGNELDWYSIRTHQYRSQRSNLFQFSLACHI